MRYDANVAPDPAAWRALDNTEAAGLVLRYHRRERPHPPAPNQRVHALFHVIVENQVAMGDEIPTAATVERLMSEGLSRHEAIHAIGSLLAKDIHRLLKEGGDEPDYSREEYHRQLRALTARSWRESALEYDGAAEEGFRDELDEDREDDEEENFDGDHEESWAEAGDEEILAALAVPLPAYPAGALRAAQRAGGRLTEHLLRIIEETRQAALRGEEVRGNAHLYAMLLLARLEESRAFDVIAKFFTMPEETYDPLVGDFLTEDLPRVLAAVCGGSMDRLLALAQDGSRDQWIRGAALHAIVALAQRGRLTRAAVATRIAPLLRVQPEGLDEASRTVLSAAVDVVLDLYLDELFDLARETIRKAKIGRAEGLEDCLDAVKRDGLKTTLRRTKQAAYYQPVRDVVEETEWWACFDPASLEDERDGEGWYCEECAEEHPADDEPYVRAQPKVGRNDPCPCGSGKKYKKCCYLKGA